MPGLYLVATTDHLETVNKHVETLGEDVGNVCLKTEDGENIFMDKVLLTLFSRSLGDILNDNISEKPVIILPVHSSIFQQMIELRLKGFVWLKDEEDIGKIVTGFATLGEDIQTEQLIKQIVENKASRKYDVKTDLCDLVAVKLEEEETEIKSDIKTKEKKKRKVEQMTRCEDCRFYSKRGALKVHILEKHSGIEPLANIDIKVEKEHKEEGKIVKKSNEIKCHYCEVIVLRANLKRHIVQSHPEKKAHKCLKCDYECDLRKELVRHMNLDHTESQICQYCQRVVKFMDTHLEKFHFDELSKFPCNKCSFETRIKRKLDSHVRRKHENIRGKCDKCNRYVHIIRLHMKRHNMNKFECVPCVKNFSVRRDLCRHILYEHEKKVSQCTICGKDSVTNLKSHMMFKHGEKISDSVGHEEKIERDRIATLIGDNLKFMG